VSNSELMLAAIQAGQHDDATVSAALDAFHEENQCALLWAVIEVALAFQSGEDARLIARATKLLDRRSVVRAPMLELLRAECSQVPVTGRLDVHIVAGDVHPTGIDVSLVFPDGEYLAGEVTVGAEWMLTRANVIRKNLSARRADNRRAKKK